MRCSSAQSHYRLGGIQELRVWRNKQHRRFQKNCHSEQDKLLLQCTDGRVEMAALWTYFDFAASMRNVDSDDIYTRYKSHLMMRSQKTKRPPESRNRFQLSTRSARPRATARTNYNHKNIDKIIYSLDDFLSVEGRSEPDPVGRANAARGEERGVGRFDSLAASTETIVSEIGINKTE